MSGSSRLRWWTLRALGAAAILFGIVTVAEGGRTLFGGPEARAAAGAYVPFVLWFNFLAGFAYIGAGAGLVAGCRWAGRLALVIAAATLLVFAAFALHIAMGGAYEARTVAAMTLRSAFWAATAWLALRRPAAPATG
jgi:hypothetical protein